MSVDTMRRLGRRGEIVIKAFDGSYDVQLKAPGPYRGRSSCTTDEGDFWSYCHLGASNWHGEGTDLDALLTECEEATRPRHANVDDLRWSIECRRNSRTYGPPLPDYLHWRGWRPGTERWLRIGHQHEYLTGYLRYLETERELAAKSAAADRRRRQAHARHILTGRA